MENIPPHVWALAHELVARNATTNSTSTTSSTSSGRPASYKTIGLLLAVCSGLFIGTSFVLKKTGLLKANAKYNEEAGEGYGYLKNAFWWTGMTLMIVGEICNFVAYAFVDAILVTPLGALSVVVTTILSAIFLKERLSFVGKVGCFNCIIGSVVIVMNAPQQSAVKDIQEMKHFVIAPGFLSYAGVIIVGCAFIALWVGPRYGKKSMLVYLSICSLIGGLSVVATQGLGSAIVAQASGEAQFNQWFLYLLLVFVVTTLVTEIIFLNKALNLFNAALVTPTYYVFFTSATIVTSAVLFRGFHGTAVEIATVIMGFLQICAGVILLQMSKSAKDVPDAAVFKGDLDQIREIGEQEQPESEPKADAIRGAAAIVRRFSTTRQKMEQEEARRLREDKQKDHLEPLRENEVVEWDGLRRRKTVIGEPGLIPVRRKTIHPPLGMSHFPAGDDGQRDRESSGLFESLRERTKSVIHRNPKHSATDPTNDSMQSPMHPVALTDITIHPSKVDSPIVPYGPGSFEEAEEHIYGLPPGLRKDRNAPQPSPRSKPLPAQPPGSPALRPPQEARRQFSFTNFLHRNSHTPADQEQPRPPSRPNIGSRGSSAIREQKKATKNATEEERLGLVKGDSHHALLAEQSPDRSAPPPTVPHFKDEEQYRYHYSNPSRPSSLSDSDSEWQMTQMTPQSERDQPRILTETMPQRVSPPQQILQSSPSRGRQRPPVPMNYPVHPPIPSTDASNTSRTNTTGFDRKPVAGVASPPNVPGTMPGTMPRVGQVQGRPTPQADQSDPFLSSSTNTTNLLDQPPSSRQRGGVGLGVAPVVAAGRSRPPQIIGAVIPEHPSQEHSEDDNDGGGFSPRGEDLRRDESPEDYRDDAADSRRRFEEQSKREREERRLRQARRLSRPDGNGLGNGSGFV